MIQDVIAPSRAQKLPIGQERQPKRKELPVVVISESNVLSNIDGFLVTDGQNIRVTIRSGLSRVDNDRVLHELLKRSQSNTTLGIYMYSLTEDNACT